MDEVLLVNILNKLNDVQPEFNHLTYVGKKYSKADLVKDLEQLLKGEINEVEINS